ncbi:ATP-binding protein [Streptomyces sp. NPDC002055]|uniref:ATP-binding protein n=1 Tax=Streptomyces sp. NPDC002055 TaxID=3154534 RepID=UPI003330E026
MIVTVARATGTGAPGYSETFPCKPESAQRARLLVSVALSAWGIRELDGAGTQIVAELVNNSISHTGSRAIRVVVSRKDATVRIGVVDRSRDVPVLGKPDGESENGRGLLLVDALSTNWGYDRKRWGKVVWAELLNPEDLSAEV